MVLIKTKVKFKKPQALVYKAFRNTQYVSMYTAMEVDVIVYMHVPLHNLYLETIDHIYMCVRDVELWTYTLLQMQTNHIL